MPSIVLGGGCFWCLDAAYRQVKGVTDTEVGYSGGKTSDPTYEQVSTGETGHAEVCKVTYDPDVISLDQILDVFWIIHDPTSINRQGADVGTQYRSCIFYDDREDLSIIQKSIAHIQTLWEAPLVTEVMPLDGYWRAEEYHQDYFNKNPEAGYCQAVINPKLAKLRQKAAELIA